MKGRLDVGVLGATGIVGQEIITALVGHPWFELTWIGASERSVGKRYAAATPWRLAASRPEDVSEMIVERCVPGVAPMLLFSGLDSSIAGEVERAFAVAGHTVVSNARNHRMDADVPLVIPEINADHLQLLEEQRRVRQWKGKIVTNPNCSTILMALALAPLRQFGLTHVTISTLQAVSGSGYPGVSSLDIIGNILPYIDGEESKIENEAQKILGSLVDRKVVPHEVVVSAQATRVPVINGHTALISVKFESSPTATDIIKAFRDFSGRPQSESLPSAPGQPVCYLDEPDRPQPKLDVGREGGMVITVGRLRECSVLDYKFIALGHNTIRGAAGAAVLNAELMKADGLLGEVEIQATGLGPAD